MIYLGHEGQNAHLVAFIVGAYFAHTIAEVLDLVGFILIFAWAAQSVMAGQRSGRTAA